MIPSTVYYKTYKPKDCTDNSIVQYKFAVLGYVKDNEGTIHNQGKIDKLDGELQSFDNVPHRGIKLTDYSQDNKYVILSDTVLGFCKKVAVTDILPVIAKFGYSPENGLDCTCLYEVNNVSGELRLIPMSIAEHDQYLIEHGPGMNLSIKELKIGHYYTWNTKEGYYLGKITSYNIVGMYTDQLHNRWGNSLSTKNPSYSSMNFRGKTESEVQLFCDKYMNFSCVYNSSKHIYNERDKEYFGTDLRIIPTYDEAQVNVLRNMYRRTYHMPEWIDNVDLEKNMKIKYESLLYPPSCMEDNYSGGSTSKVVCGIISPDSKHAYIFDMNPLASPNYRYWKMLYAYNIDYDGSVTAVFYTNADVIFPDKQSILEKFPGYKLFYFKEGKYPYKHHLLAKTTDGKVVYFKN